LGGNAKYTIPIYQRPYSWGDAEIRKLLSDIFTSYWGNDGTIVNEPMFIGTMQLSPGENGSMHIIDGQQRLTTLLLLIKVLHNDFGEVATDFTFDWLSTKVNNGVQQEYLTQALESPLDPEGAEVNPYLRNALMVREIYYEFVRDDEGTVILTDPKSFYDFLAGNLYFVVIETRASLSKTLQIFNAINTTGMDLNGGDLFKLHFYEYLTRNRGYSEDVFEDISSLYQKIDNYNAQHKRQVSDINQILRIYQYILIARHKLSPVLYTLATSTFFERLFETIINKAVHENYAKAEKAELSLDDIDRIIEARYKWEDSLYPTVEDACAMHFIWQSRYHRHWIILFVYLYQFNDKQSPDVDFWAFIRQLSKFYLIYSIRFQKAINHIHTQTYSLMSKIIHEDKAAVTAFLEKGIGTLDSHSNGYYNLQATLNGNIVYNAKMKNLICRLSAMLHETYTSADQSDINAVVHKLFNTPIDIEHIQSYHHKDGTKNEAIWAEWKDNLNSLGNLMVLEQDINRSIKNNGYDIKQVKYKKSTHAIVRKQIIEYPDWDLEKCTLRKLSEIKSVSGYLFPAPTTPDKEEVQV
jgi:hypothetical protein